MIWELVSVRVSPSAYERMTHANFIKMDSSLVEINKYLQNKKQFVVCDDRVTAANKFKKYLQEMYFNIHAEYLEVKMHVSKEMAGGVCFIDTGRAYLE